jgi:hypothetical protein
VVGALLAARAILLSVAAMLMFASSSAAAPPPGNSGAAHACHQGGYVYQVRPDGTGFSSTGECVSWAAHGGTLIDVRVVASIRVTAPASATAGQGFPVSATGINGVGGVVGDVTSHTTFSLSPDGSCTAATCTATKAGTHTVHGVDGALSGDASPTIVNPAALDHLSVSPATATVCPFAAAPFANFSCEPSLPFGVLFTAEGFDQYGNDLGDVTANTTFSVSPPRHCEFSSCEVGNSVSGVTLPVFAVDGTASGGATLVGATPTMTCQGEHYDVNGNPSDGCEVSQPLQGAGTMGSAAFEGDQSDCDVPGFSFSGILPSDARTHENPQVVGFDPATGSTPVWTYLTGVGHPFCQNDVVVTLSTSNEASPSHNGCYHLTVVTDTHQYAAQTDSTGTASISELGGQFPDNTNIYFEVSKTCGTNVTENISWTLSGHL